MKIRFILPVALMAFLLTAPQANAQSRRDERKLKKEMRKLDRQMQKVRDLQEELNIPDYRELRSLQENQLEHAREMGRIQRELAREQRELAQQEAQRARELARSFREEHQQQFNEQRRRMEEESEIMREFHHQELDKIKEHLPDLEELHEFDIEIPDIDLDFHYIHPSDHDLHLSTINESENSMVINKRFENESLAKDYTYTVADEATFLDLRVNGSVKSGSVKITITSPDGEEYQSFDITPAADIQWKQQMKFENEEQKAKIGKWTISITAEDTSGNFSVRMRSK